MKLKKMFPIVALLLIALMAGCKKDDTISILTVTSKDPLQNVTGVPRNQAVAFTFSEAMDPLTINGSTFTLTQGTTAIHGTVTYSGTTATFTPNPTYAAGDPRSTLGNPTWSDTMEDARNWPMGVNDYTSIAFNNGELALTALKSNVSGWRLAGTISLNSVYIEQTGKMVACATNDSYGIIFRVPILADSNKGYLFGIQCDGQYYLKSYDATRTPDTVVIVQPTANAAIIAGSGKTNRIGVWAKGNTIKLYANGILLQQLTDSTFATGYLGVFVRKGVTDGLTARITEMDYWILP